MKNSLLILIIVMLCTTGNVMGQWEPQTVINQRAISNQFVSDADGNLDPADVMQLNRILQETEQATGVQFAIVIVNEISEKWDIMSFGVELFNHWGLGQREKNNGLMLLIVMNTREWRFFSGYGVEGQLPDALLIRLGNNHIVPAFRDNQYGKGLTEVSEKIRKILIDRDKEAAVAYHMKYEPWWDTFQLTLWLVWLAIMGIALYSDQRKKKKQPKAPETKSVFKTELNAAGVMVLAPDKPAKTVVWGHDRLTRFVSLYFMAGIVPGMASYYDEVFSNPVGNAFIGMYIYLLLLSVIVQYKINKNANQVSADGPSRFLNLSGANNAMILRILLFPMAFLPYYFLYKKRLNRLKDQAIDCGQCSLKARPLQREVYPEYLSPAELVEIKEKSRDTRLYQCDEGHITKILFEGKLAPAFRMCQKCKTLTMVKTGEETLVSATYTSQGNGRREFTCRHCGAKMLVPFVIPVKQRSSPGSGSGSGGSRGGSWGGGRTGGGGAGGRW